MEGFLRLIHTPLGYDPHNVMSVGIPVHDGAYPTWEARKAYFEQLRSKAATVPGVTMAAISSNATPPSNGWQTGIEILGQAAARRAEDPRQLRKPRIFSDPANSPGDREEFGMKRKITTPRMWPSSTRRWRSSTSRMAMRSEHSLRVPEIKDEPPYVTTASGGGHLAADCRHRCGQAR